MLDMGFIDDINYILQSGSEESSDGPVSPPPWPQEIVRLSQRLPAQPFSPYFIGQRRVVVDTVDQKIVQLEEDDKFRALCSFLEKDLNK